MCLRKPSASSGHTSERGSIWSQNALWGDEGEIIALGVWGSQAAAAGSHHLARTLLGPLRWVRGGVVVTLLYRGWVTLLPAASPSSAAITCSDMPETGW